MKFNYKEDDKFTPERLCEEEGYTLEKKSNHLYLVNGQISINYLNNTIYDLHNDKYKKCDSKEDIFFMTKNIIALQQNNK